MRFPEWTQWALGGEVMYRDLFNWSTTVVNRAQGRHCPRMSIWEAHTLIQHYHHSVVRLKRSSSLIMVSIPAWLCTSPCRDIMIMMCDYIMKVVVEIIAIVVPWSWIGQWSVRRIRRIRKNWIFTRKAEAYPTRSLSTIIPPLVARSLVGIQISTFPHFHLSERSDGLDHDRRASCQG